MKKAGLVRIPASCLFVVVAAVSIAYGGKGGIISVKDIESMHSA